MPRQIIFLLLCLFLSCERSNAYTKFMWQIPNGTKNTCNNCHSISTQLNKFGLQVAGNYSNFKIDWHSLYNLDADGDGFTNGEELQDPNGTWTSGAIGDTNNVTLPGDASSHPTSVFESNGSEVNKLIVDIAPSSGIAMLKFSISTPGNTSAMVYDMMGNLVLKSDFGNLAEGSFNMLLPLTNKDGASIGKGVFFITIVSGNSVRLAKIVL